MMQSGHEHGLSMYSLKSCSQFSQLVLELEIPITSIITSFSVFFMFLLLVHWYS